MTWASSRGRVFAAAPAFLEAFRIRSEHAASFDANMKEAIAARLIEEYGSPESAADAVFERRDNDWLNEGVRLSVSLKQEAIGRCRRYQPRLRSI